MVAQWRRSKGKLAENGAATVHDLVCQRVMTCRIHHIDTCTDDGNRAAGAGHRPRMGRCVDAEREAGHHHESRPGQGGGKRVGILRPLHGGLARADDADGRRRQRIAPAVDVEKERGIGEVEQPGRIVTIGERDEVMARCGEPRLGARDQRRQRGIGRGGQDLGDGVRHQPMQPGSRLRQHRRRQAERAQQPARGRRGQSWRRNQPQPRRNVGQPRIPAQGRPGDLRALRRAPTGQRGVVAMSPTFIRFVASVTSAYEIPGNTRYT
ncbi:hypothetical protein D3C86_1500820 [compost metagenome]